MAWLRWRLQVEPMVEPPHVLASRASSDQLFQLAPVEWQVHVRLRHVLAAASSKSKLSPLHLLLL